MTVRSALAHIGLVLFGIALALALIELLLRVVPLFDYRIKGDRIVLPINRTYEIKVNAGNGLEAFVTHRKNALGFRGPEPPEDWDETVTVLAVGGSTTESFYISDGRTWPERFGALARDVIRPLWVNNAGLDGHSSFGHAVLLEDVLAPLRPDAVLFLVGWNDIGRLALGKSDRNQLRAGGGTGFRDIAIWLANNTEVAGLALNLYRSWKTRRMGLGHDATFFDWSRPPPPRDVPAAEVAALLETHRERYLPAYRARLQHLVATAQSAGIRPILVTQPAVYGGGADPRTGADLDRMDARYGNGAVTWRVLELYNDVARAIAADAGIELVDLAAAMPKDSTYFYDAIHFNVAGSERIAEIVFHSLCPWLVAEFPSHVVGACPMD